MGAHRPMGKPQWRASVLALATVVLLGVPATEANALALGRVTVQSALGEPLRAEIDIPQINADELASLRAAVASPDAFRTAGLEYNPALASLRITLQRRPDGTHFLHLSSTRPVTEPFLDLILETNWSTGRIVRDYTMLFDPPNLRPAAPPIAAQVSPAPAARSSAQPSVTATAKPPAGRGAARNAATGDGKQVTVHGGDTAGKIAAANKPPSVSLDQMLVAMLRANPQAFIGGNVNRLRSGVVLEIPSAEQAGGVPSGEARQTVIAQSRDFNEFRRRLAEGLPATRIGAAERQASGKVQAQVEEKKADIASPDKLTLSKGAVQDKGAADKIARDRAAQDAALRVAELNKNIADLNKLGSATGTTVPAGTASAAKPGSALPAGGASAAKSGLPGPTVVVGGASVTKPAAATPAPAPLPAAPAIAAAPPVISAPAASAPAAASPLAAAVAASAPAAASPVASAASAANPAAMAASAPANAASAESAAAAAAATGAQSTDGTALAAPAASAAKPAPVPPLPAETSLVDDMLENPIVPATLGGVLALLLGFGFYRAQKRRKSTQVDSSFLESRLQPDSFFGASGGQRIDTNEGAATGSSMVYSPSQLDAAGDVDPVAEADVYLAYGRDLQAEEILKEAMRTTPQRVAIHSKLLEIYSKRRDTKAFELVAAEAYGLSRGQGPEWDHICELGQELDPHNSLYRPGGKPLKGASAATAAAAIFGSTAAQTQPVAAAVSDLDLDLDFSIGDDEPAPVAPPPVRPAATREPTANLNPLPESEPVPHAIPNLDVDFSATEVALKAVDPLPDLPRAQPAASERLDAPVGAGKGNESSLTFDVLPATAANPPMQTAAPARPVAAPAVDAGMIEFDLGALSLDLESPPAETASAKPDLQEEPVSTAGASLDSIGFEDTGGDPLATKLALAQEFNAIGDPDGARSLAQEVLAEASGELKTKAQRFLAEIS